MSSPFSSVRANSATSTALPALGAGVLSVILAPDEGRVAWIIRNRTGSTAAYLSFVELEEQAQNSNAGHMLAADQSLRSQDLQNYSGGVWGSGDGSLLIITEFF